MRRRILSAATVAAALGLAALTGCASPGDARAECSVPLSPGALSSGVEVTAGGDLTVTGSTDILNAQRSVISHGDAGALAVPGGVAVLNLDLFDAVTGELLQSQQNAPYVVLPESLLPEAQEVLASADSGIVPMQYLIAVSLLCSAPGDTIVVAATPEQSATSQLSVNATVAVVEVIDTFAARAEGRTRGLPNGFPAVAIDETGRPGIVLPPRAAPDDVQSAAHIEGDGDAVTDAQSVIGHVLSVGWDGEIVTNTWESGLVVFGSADAPTGTYTFRDQLTGYPAGSQVVIIDPNGGAPVVHVVDIVAVV